MEKQVPVFHCFDKSKLEDIKKHGLNPILNLGEKYQQIDRIADTIAITKNLPWRRSSAVHAISPCWTDMQVGFCRTKEMDNYDDPVAVFDVDEDSPVYYGEYIQSVECERLDPPSKECVRLLTEGWAEVQLLRELYSASDLWAEILVPAPIPPEKLRIYPNIKEALHQEKFTCDNKPDKPSGGRKPQPHAFHATISPKSLHPPSK